MKIEGIPKFFGMPSVFNTAQAKNSENQISTKKLNKIVKLDGENKLLTVEAGARYGEFSVELHEKGFGLHNLASLPHITVGGHAQLPRTDRGSKMATWLQKLSPSS